jgi:hypothetical protein
MVLKIISPVVKWPGRETDHTSTPNAEFRNVDTCARFSFRSHELALNIVTYVTLGRDRNICIVSPCYMFPSPGI